MKAWQNCGVGWPDSQADSAQLYRPGCGIGKPGEPFTAPQAIIVRTVGGALPHPEGHDVTAGDDLLAGQVAYYRRRASEYDVTAYPDLDAARARITRIVAALRPAGNVLEIACGTGLWTSALAAAATAVTAIDAAPEMAGIARGRVTAANVRFEVAAVFSWAAAARFDTVFFAFWLSHVPASRFEQFWRQRWRPAPAPGGSPATAARPPRPSSPSRPGWR